MKKSQIWIETVIYTLIGLAILGILLSFVKPALDEKKDRILIEQTENLLNSIHSQVEEIKFYGPGNSRDIELKIKKGKLIISPEEDKIEFSIETKYLYSEPGKEVESGKIKILTTKISKNYEVSLKLDYSQDYDLTWQKAGKEKIFQPSPTPYKVLAANNGMVNEKLNIDFSYIQGLG